VRWLLLLLLPLLLLLLLLLLLGAGSRYLCARLGGSRCQPPACGGARNESYVSGRKKTPYTARPSKLRKPLDAT
jgi:hypothetical protein